MRFAGQAKMGYSSTPGQVIPVIASYLKRECEGLIRVLDPCAGIGVAVKKIGDALQAETCGVEIDQERGNFAKGILDRRYCCKG